MSNHNVENRVQALEQNVLIASQTLKEYEKMQQRVLDTLQKIHEALVGQVDIQSSGLIEEVRNLKREQLRTFELINETNKKVEVIQNEIKQLKETKIPAIEKKSSRILEIIKKYKYMAAGALLVISFLLKPLGEFAINNFGKLIKQFFP